MKPACVFNVSVEPRSRLSVIVEIYRTTGEFRRTARAEAKRARTRYRTRGLVGMCCGVTIRGRKSRRVFPQFAIIRIPKNHLTMTTITHECFHATMRWAERRGIRAIPTGGGPSNMRPYMRDLSIEERAATVHDRLCRRVVRQLERRGLLP